MQTTVQEAGLKGARRRWGLRRWVKLDGLTDRERQEVVELVERRRAAHERHADEGRDADSTD